LVVLASELVPFADRVRLGEDFELDLRAYELRKAGRALKLERIPMDLLVLLVEHRGELVTRDQIIAKIWGKDVFLDTDASINSAIRKIRHALKDDPERPRFVQTASGRGYRFIAPIEQITASGKDHVVEMAGTESPGSSAVADTIAPREPAAPASPRRRGWLVPTAALLIAFALAAVIAAVMHLSHSRTVRLTAEDTVVLADFANSTGDPIFDDTLKEALTVSLRQSPFLNILSERKVAKTLKLMTREPTTALTPEVAAEVCQRAGSKAFVAGAIARLGSEYVLGLKAVNCRSGETLAQAQVTAASKEQVLVVLGDVATRFRGELGESLTTVEKFDVPLTEATTSSLEALRAYTIGVKTWNSKGELEALPFLQRALELDPKFATAYASLGVVYRNLERPGLAAESMSKAYELRERASEREKFYILGHYYADVTGDLEKALPVYEQWRQEYPSDPTPRTNSGNIYLQFGNYEQGLARHREAQRVEPNGVLIYENIALTNIYLNRLDEAVASVQAAYARNLDDVSLHALLFQIAFFRRDTATLEREMAWGMGKPGVEDIFLDGQADVEASQGHIAKAHEFIRRAVDSAVRSGSKETAAGYQALDALLDAEVGNLQEAARKTETAMALATNQVTEFLAALTFARVGKPARATVIVNRLDQDYPSSTGLQSYWLPSIRAAIQVQSGDGPAAIQSLQATVLHELGASRPFAAIYPVYIRGQAFLLAHQGPAAAAEFQKILDHRTLTTFVTGSLAQLQLARAYAMSHEISKAKAAYEEFFTLWKDADPDVPIVKVAKAEYANLKAPS
jgi:DNA-binding winged helix-turn-helix (wHTH) protein/Flp pilus assembly protein TadD